VPRGFVENGSSENIARVAGSPVSEKDSPGSVTLPTNLHARLRSPAHEAEREPGIARGTSRDHG
jgi:hypothetical protein